MGGHFLATQLHGKGNVVMVTGVAGTSVDTDRNNGVESVIKKYPNMKIIAHYRGNWDSSTAQRATAAQLPSLPQVDGVWVSGGTDGVVKAFIDAGKPVPIVSGEGENGHRRSKPPPRFHRKQGNRLALRPPPVLTAAAPPLPLAHLHPQHAHNSDPPPPPALPN